MQAAIRGVSGDSGLCDFVIFRGIVQSHEALIENSETTVSVSELVGVPVQDTEHEVSTGENNPRVRFILFWKSHITVKDSTRRRFLRTGGVVGIAGLTGCSQITGGNSVKDTDGDGVIDSEDYAPRDASVQDAEDIDDGQTGAETPESADFAPFTVTLRGRSTFVKKSNDDSSIPPPIISLDEKNIEPGDVIFIEISGSISISDGDDRVRCNVVGVFSRTDEIRGINQRNRVPGAIDAEGDAYTGPTENIEAETDIPEDFAVSRGTNSQQCTNTGTTATVPSGANYLMFGIDDSSYDDNSGEITIEIRPA